MQVITRPSRSRQAGLPRSPRAAVRYDPLAVAEFLTELSGMLDRVPPPVRRALATAAEALTDWQQEQRDALAELLTPPATRRDRASARERMRRRRTDPAAEHDRADEVCTWLRDLGHRMRTGPDAPNAWADYDRIVEAFDVPFMVAMEHPRPR